MSKPSLITIMMTKPTILLLRKETKLMILIAHQINQLILLMTWEQLLRQTITSAIIIKALIIFQIMI